MTAQAATNPPATGPSSRLVSLDAFRGFIMFWISDGRGLVLGLLALLADNPVRHALDYQLNHSVWDGLRFYDCIWPSFMLMAGLSLPFSFAKRSLTQTQSQLRRHVLKRFAVLFLLGSLRETVMRRAPYLVELSSALQPIAIAYLVAFLLARKSARVVGAVALALLAGYGALLAFVAPPGHPASPYELNTNLVTAVDMAVLGRAHEEGWGTVISTIPTISTTLLGVLLGRLLMGGRPAREKLAAIAGTGLGCLAAGWLLSFAVPVVMKLWTPSYGLLTAGWASLILAAHYWLIDMRGLRRWAFPFVVIGMNALAFYMFHTLTRLPEVAQIIGKGLGGRFQVSLAALVLFTAEWLILYWLYKRKIFLTA
jgi:predicted acyltransferase